MRLIYFTKFLGGLTAAEVGQTAAELGFEGLDLAIRAGQCVNPQNVREALPAAMKLWQTRGLSVPLVTLEGNATDPADSAVQDIFHACGEAGIPLIKLGYWHWRPGQDYWQEVDRIRKSLVGFGDLARKSGVCCLVHTHSGACYGCNASSAMHLVRDLDPDHVGVYLDPAHLEIVGEPLPMALDIAGRYLRMIAAKNAAYREGDSSQSPRWNIDWCSLAEGLVDWPSAVETLRSFGYTGDISVHGEYSFSEKRDEILPRVAEDRAYLARALGA